jgi:hypothetical protein
MNRGRTFTYVAALIFAVMGVVHLIRVFKPFQIVFGTHAVPMWGSYIAVVVAFGLAWMLCREARGRSTV